MQAKKIFGVFLDMGGNRQKFEDFIMSFGANRGQADDCFLACQKWASQNL